jgi:hypothetical protein
VTKRLHEVMMKAIERKVPERCEKIVKDNIWEQIIRSFDQLKNCPTIGTNNKETIPPIIAVITSKSIP